jgi:hypothetical protein
LLWLLYQLQPIISKRSMSKTLNQRAYLTCSRNMYVTTVEYNLPGFLREWIILDDIVFPESCTLTLQVLRPLFRVLLKNKCEI